MTTPPPTRLPDEERGPFKAKRDPKSYPSRHKALLPEHQQDWVYARAQYEAGVKSVALIAKEIGVSVTGFYSRIGNGGWTRDRTALAQKEVELKIANEQAEAQQLIVERDRAERVNAEMQARVLVTHRADIRRARSLTMRLFSELESMMDLLPDLQELGTLLRSEDERGRDRLNDIYQKVLSLPDRVDVNKKLSDSLKVQILLERQAFGIAGALEDPETQVAVQVGESEIDKILGKFDLVMKKKEPQTKLQGILGDIVDVPTAN